MPPILIFIIYEEKAGNRLKKIQAKLNRDVSPLEVGTQSPGKQQRRVIRNGIMEIP